MVLWCFNVTVLNLSCRGAINVLKPQPTKNKVGSSLSLASPPLFGAVSLGLCLLCYYMLQAVFVLLFLVVAK